MSGKFEDCKQQVALLEAQHTRLKMSVVQLVGGQAESDLFTSP